MKIREKIEIYHSDTSWSELPNRIQKLFSNSEECFYNNLLIERESIIEKCQNEAIKLFFINLRKNDYFRVYIKSENNEVPLIYWFISFPVERDGISFRLPVNKSLPGDPPLAVIELYKHIGGIDENLEYYCGWDAPENIKSLRDRGYVVDDHDMSQFFPIFSFGNGDYAGYVSNDSGFMFDHENNQLLEFDLDVFIKEYFGNFFNRRGNDANA